MHTMWIDLANVCIHYLLLKTIAAQENYLCMQVTFSTTKIFILCNDVIHIATRIFNWTVSRFHFHNLTPRSLSLPFSLSHSSLPLSLLLFATTYINIILICVCLVGHPFISIQWNNMIFVNRINAHTLSEWVCVCRNPYQPTNQRKAHSTTTMNSFD